MKTNNIITVKVEFSNPIYNYSTRFNGTLANAQHYFINKSFNFGDDEKENFQLCINVSIVFQPLKTFVSDFTGDIIAQTYKDTGVIKVANLGDYTMFQTITGTLIEITNSKLN